MKQVSVTLSTYTADVSGVCSALYELGGMVVIHDPSGCNSTYNTHDEPRWYDMDSLVFISGLSQMDAIMGNDDKFIKDIVRAARELNPKFIALVRTPIPLMTGTDFEGIARVIKKQTGIPVFYFPTTGMQTYVRGAGMALETVARKLVEDIAQHNINKRSRLTEDTAQYNTDKDSEMTKSPVVNKAQEKTEHGAAYVSSDEIKNDTGEKAKHKKYKINILGATPLDFSVNSTIDSIKEFLGKYFDIISTFAMGSSIEDIQKAGQADVNLVISSVGVPAARVLEERFHTPYVIGTPIRGFENIIVEKLLETAWNGKSETAYLEVTGKRKKDDTGDLDNLIEDIQKAGEAFRAIDKLASAIKESQKGTENKVYIIGEAVTSQSLKAALALKHGIDSTVICPLETEPEYIGKNVLLLSSEEEIKEALFDAQVVIADPIYQTICSENMHFIPLPHEAFSGRIYRKEIPDLAK